MEKFFRTSICFTEVGLKDFLLKRYHCIDYKMNARDFIDLVLYARNQDQEEKVDALWCSLYPYMILKQIKYIPLNDFKEKAMGKNIDTRPIEDIEKEIQLARDRFERK